MPRTVYINFGDLDSTVQEDILRMAEDDIRADEDEMNDIREMYGEDSVDEIVAERAERKICEFEFVFNV